MNCGPGHVPTMTQNPYPNGKQETRIKFLSPEELKRDLLVLADERNITLSALLRLITSEYVRRHKQP